MPIAAKRWRVCFSFRYFRLAVFSNLFKHYIHQLLNVGLGGVFAMSDTGRVDNVMTYGHATAIVGVLLAVGIIWFMFAVADGFS